MKNNLKTLVSTLLTEGKCIKREVIDNTLILTVEAFGHTYIIEGPHTRGCKIKQITGG